MAPVNAQPSTSSIPKQLQIENSGIMNYAIQDKIDTIRGILPHVDMDRIRDALNRNGGNMEASISTLLDN